MVTNLEVMGDADFIDEVLSQVNNNESRLSKPGLRDFNCETSFDPFDNEQSGNVDSLFLGDRDDFIPFEDAQSSKGELPDSHFQHIYYQANIKAPKEQVKIKMGLANALNIANSALPEHLLKPATTKNSTCNPLCLNFCKLKPKMQKKFENRTTFKHTIVFDIDETLLHTMRFDSKNQFNNFDQLPFFPDAIVQLGAGYPDMALAFRPGLVELLDSLVDEFELIAFTAGSSSYFKVIEIVMK